MRRQHLVLLNTSRTPGQARNDGVRQRLNDEKDETVINEETDETVAVLNAFRHAGQDPASSRLFLWMLLAQVRTSGQARNDE
jgi:hypothetical protein